jgi:hypothetical protein
MGYFDNDLQIIDLVNYKEIERGFILRHPEEGSITTKKPLHELLIPRKNYNKKYSNIFIDKGP